MYLSGGSSSSGGGGLSHTSHPAGATTDVPVCYIVVMDQPSTVLFCVVFVCVDVIGVVVRCIFKNFV